jgi:uncharacterized protein (TIGR02594 family)
MSTQIEMQAEPPWLVVARAELGVHETSGAGDTKRVQEYFGATGMGPHTHDAVPWCSAFVNFCMAGAGIEGTHSAAARSWLDWGRPLLKPKLGCVIVFSRPLGGPQSGHVGFYVGDNSEPIAPGQRMVSEYHVLSGNQSDRVCVAAYPASRVLGWRWPAELG